MIGQGAHLTAHVTAHLTRRVLELRLAEFTKRMNVDGPERTLIERIARVECSIEIGFE